MTPKLTPIKKIGSNEINEKMPCLNKLND